MNRVVAGYCVLGDADGVTSLQTLHRGCANAGMQVHSSQDHGIAVQQPQSSIQFGIRESVETRFVDYGLAALRFQRRGRLMSTCPGHALPAICEAPVRQTPIVVAVNSGPNVYDRDPQPATASQQ